jgi:hypothetical protein
MLIDSVNLSKAEGKVSKTAQLKQKALEIAISHKLEKLIGNSCDDNIMRDFMYVLI